MAKGKGRRPVEIDSSLAEEIRRKLAQLQADTTDKSQMLEQLTDLPSGMSDRQSRLLEKIRFLGEECGVDQQALMTVLWRGVRLCSDERYESAWFTQRRLTVERRRNLLRNAERLADDLSGLVPGTALFKAAQLLVQLLGDPAQWPPEAHFGFEGGRPLRRSKDGNPLTVLATVVRDELKQIKVTDRDDQNDLLVLVGLLPTPAVK